MSGTFYKGLGFVVWKGGTWYLRRRFGMSKRVAGGVLAAGAAGVAALAALRRNGQDD